MLSTSALTSFAQTGLVRTVIGRYVKPGDASGSKLFSLYTHRGPPGLFGPSQMPPLATEQVDPAGAELLRRWIDTLRYPRCQVLLREGDLGRLGRPDLIKARWRRSSSRSVPAP